MPKLTAPLHLDMYHAGKRRRNLLSRAKKALKVLVGTDDVYGLEWGDPDTNPALAYIRQEFLMPYLNVNSAVVEIGPGGGRWTRYMKNVRRLYAVDFHQELLRELRSRVRSSNLILVKNNGSDFPGVPDNSADLVFSFGTFVHLDIDVINDYLANMKRLLNPNSNVVIQYSDKRKPLAKNNRTFSDNDPATMRRLVSSHGYSIHDEDTQTLWHSSVIRFGP